MTPISITCCVATLVLLSGCGGKDESENLPPPPPPSQNQNLSVTTSPSDAPPATPPSATAPATPPAIEATVTAPQEQIKETDLERIMGAVQSYTIQYNSNPASLEELVAKGFLKSIPPAPAGKKWIYDSQKLNVVLADQ